MGAYFGQIRQQTQNLAMGRVWASFPALKIRFHICTKSFQLQNIIFEPPTVPERQDQLEFLPYGPLYRFEDDFGMFACRLGK